MTAEERLFYSPKEVANILLKNECTIVKWCKSGVVPGRKIGGTWLIPASWIKELATPECLLPKRTRTVKTP